VIAATPAVVLAHAVGGVALGVQRSALTTRLGTGVVLRHGTSDFGPYEDVYYAGPHLTVSFLQGTAETVSTSSSRHRTRQGIAVGSTEARLRAAYGRRLQCGPGACTLGRALPGHAVTTFRLAHGAVTEIAVAAVVD
jgi:hypothetical protein